MRKYKEGRHMRKDFIFFSAVVTICISLTGCHTNHEWREATCTEPRICAIGGETEGEPLGHTWTEATCTNPKTCSVCGETEGEPSGHIWTEATCTNPKTCSVCGETEGEPSGHTWTKATCTNPKTCSVCGETEGKPIDHNINYNNGKCIVCNQQIIEAYSINKDNYKNYFNITCTKTSESPCTISVEPKNKDYAYSTNGHIWLDIYQGKKATYGKGAEYANVFRERVCIDVDEKGRGSVKVTFPDYGYYIRYEVSNVALSCYKK